MAVNNAGTFGQCVESNYHVLRGSASMIVGTTYLPWKRGKFDPNITYIPSSIDMKFRSVD
jgi:hypothetical protein